MELLTIKEVSSMLGIVRQTVYTYIKRGLPTVKVGGKRMFDKKEVEEWVEELKKKDSLRK